MGNKIIFAMLWPWVVILTVITLHYANVIDVLNIPTYIVISIAAIPSLAVIGWVIHKLNK